VYVRRDQARGKLLSSLVKKNVMQNIVPILIELKKMVEQRKSPLLRDVMMYMKELFSDPMFRQDIDDVLAVDPQLAAEIAYDIRQFEQQQQLRYELSPCAPLAL